jgi:hypothetical protein
VIFFRAVYGLITASDQEDTFLCSCVCMSVTLLEVLPEIVEMKHACVKVLICVVYLIILMLYWFVAVKRLCLNKPSRLLVGDEGKVRTDGA